MSKYIEEKGICLFAYNNEQIDYGALAVLCARQAKRMTNLPVCLITTSGTIDWLNQSHGNDFVDKNIDYIVTTDDVEFKENERGHFDSPWSSFKAQFLNSNKHNIWEYSPFEKTLLLDIDYFLNTDYLVPFLDHEGVTMFENAVDIENRLPHQPEQYLAPNGIPMWWSTVVAFDRSEFSRLFFETWAHVADNYSYYQMLYNFPSHLFRTDYCVSVAAHILNGMGSGDQINTFGVPMCNMSQKDDILKVENDYWYFLSNNRTENWKDIAVKIKNLDVHLMNKRAIMRHWDSIWEAQNV